MSLFLNKENYLRNKLFLRFITSRSKVSRWFVALFFVCGAYYIYKHFRSSTLNVPSPSPLFKVKVKESDASLKTQYYTTQGFVEFAHKITLKAEIPGEIKKIFVEKGSFAKKGQFLLSIDLKARQAKLKEAESLLEQRGLEYRAAQTLAAKKFKSLTHLADAKARYDGAKAALSEAKDFVETGSIKAPFDGIFEEKFIEEGDTIQIGDKLATFIRKGSAQVIVQVPEINISAVKKESEVEMTFASGKQHTGKITFVSHLSDPTLKTFRVEIALGDLQDSIFEGMTATVHVPLNKSMMHEVSPAVLTLNDRGILGVLTVDDVNQVIFSPIEVGYYETERVWIKGLASHARIIVGGQEFVKPGQHVDVQKETQ